MNKKVSSGKSAAHFLLHKRKREKVMRVLIVEDMKEFSKAFQDKITCYIKNLIANYAKKMECSLSRAKEILGESVELSFVIVTSAEEGMKYFTTEKIPFDLTLMDTMLLGVQKGTEAAKEIKDQYLAAKIYSISSDKPNDEEMKFFQAYIGKTPFVLNIGLKKAIDDYLRAVVADEIFKELIPSDQLSKTELSFLFKGFDALRRNLFPPIISATVDVKTTNTDALSLSAVTPAVLPVPVMPPSPSASPGTTPAVTPSPSPTVTPVVYQRHLKQ